MSNLSTPTQTTKPKESEPPIMDIHFPVRIKNTAVPIALLPYLEEKEILYEISEWECDLSNMVYITITASNAFFLNCIIYATMDMVNRERYEVSQRIYTQFLNYKLKAV